MNKILQSMSNVKNLKKENESDNDREIHVPEIGTTTFRYCLYLIRLSFNMKYLNNYLEIDLNLKK